jgi:hypothetical protein
MPNGTGQLRANHSNITHHFSIVTASEGFLMVSKVRYSRKNSPIYTVVRGAGTMGSRHFDRHAKMSMESVNK